MSMGSINSFPYQDIILKVLESDGEASVSQIATVVAAEGRDSAEGHDSAQLHQAIAENLDHLVHLGLSEYTGSGGERSAKLTAAGTEAAARLP
jgi:Mn-dependent DtxR family transcriptional regulator